MPKPKSNTASPQGGDENAAGAGSNSEIRIEVKNSSLAEFTKRPVPTDEEVKNFENYVEEEAREEEIEEGLNEIYQDDKGSVVDVRRLEKFKKHGIIFWLFSFTLIASCLAVAGYAAYFYLYLQPGSDATAVDFSIDGKSEVLAGEEFFYTLRYKNLSNISINKTQLDIVYPENFIYLDSYPKSKAEKNNSWDLGSIAAKQAGEIKIKGMLTGETGKTGIVTANLSYTPENFSSRFNKETSYAATIKGIGLEIDFDYIASSLVGEENEITARLNAPADNYINNFRITFAPQENIEFINAPEAKPEEGKAKYTIVRPGVWQVDGISEEEKIIPIKFKFTDKISDQQDIVLDFEQLAGDVSTSSEAVKYYKFFEKKISYQVMKNDLNLTLIVNGSRNDQGVDLGQTLNYSIIYNNKGEVEMKDVVIMAVLESDLLDWASLKDNLKGVKKRNTITWSKEELPELEALGKNKEGTIDFSIKLLDSAINSQSKSYEIKSYAQFSVGKTDTEVAGKSEDNRSNIIINKINSDLNLTEAVRYFSQDNIPVGTGPHPPQVGQLTSYKVYWTLSNSLHELNELSITLKLPDDVSFDDKSRASVGDLNYNNESREIIWHIGRLPITVFAADAEFNISITPTASDKDKIMVLLPGSRVKALDSETQANIELTTKAKTTRLEDDDIAVGDGVVRE